MCNSYTNTVSSQNAIIIIVSYIKFIHFTANTFSYLKDFFFKRFGKTLIIVTRQNLI